MDFLKKAMDKGKELEAQHDISTKAKEAFEKAKELDEEHKVMDKAKGYYESYTAKKAAPAAE